MPFLRKKADTKSKQFYQTHELPLPSNIPITVELQNQKGKLGAGDAPFDATKRAYDAFGLSQEISYTIGSGKILVGATAYSRDDALKIIEKNREHIEKALNVVLGS